MSDRKLKSWKRRIVSVLICLCGSWLLYTEAMSLIAWYFAREFANNHQNLAAIPAQLKDTQREELHGPRIEKFGFSFQVPWKEIERDNSGKSFSAIFFKEGAALLLFDPSKEVDAAKIIRGNTAHDRQIMDVVLGQQTLQSNYELMYAEMQATPADIRWWAGRSRNVRNVILLTSKSMNLLDSSVIYKIDTGRVRGFQFGDPSVPPYKVHFDLFDQADMHYVIIVSGKDKRTPCITQAQINALIASFEPVSPRSINQSPSNGN